MIPEDPIQKAASAILAALGTLFLTYLLWSYAPLFARLALAFGLLLFASGLGLLAVKWHEARESQRTERDAYNLRQLAEYEAVERSREEREWENQGEARRRKLQEQQEELEAQVRRAKLKVELAQQEQAYESIKNPPVNPQPPTEEQRRKQRKKDIDANLARLDADETREVDAIIKGRLLEQLSSEEQDRVRQVNNMYRHAREQLMQDRSKVL